MVSAPPSSPLATTATVPVGDEPDDDPAVVEELPVSVVLLEHDARARAITGTRSVHFILRRTMCPRFWRESSDPEGAARAESNEAPQRRRDPRSDGPA
jgi:hypothetical protein